MGFILSFLTSVYNTMSANLHKPLGSSWIRLSVDTFFASVSGLMRAVLGIHYNQLKRWFLNSANSSESFIYNFRGCGSPDTLLSASLVRTLTRASLYLLEGMLPIHESLNRANYIFKKKKKEPL